MRDLQPLRILVLLDRLRIYVFVRTNEWIQSNPCTHLWRIKVRAHSPPALDAQPAEHVPLYEVTNRRPEIPTMGEEEMLYPRRRDDANADAMKGGVLRKALQHRRDASDHI